MDRKDLTKGRVLANIANFSLPYMLAYFLQLLYGLTDLYVIGRYCGVECTTAVSNGAQIMYMVTVVIIGLAMGSTVRIGTAFGAKDKAALAQYVGNTISFFLMLSVVLSVVLFLLSSHIISLIDTPAEAVNDTARYLNVCFLGIPFVVAYNIIASIFRGLGDSQSPMCFVAIACIVNVALDFILIGHFQMGTIGAGLATILSQLISVVFGIAAIIRQKEKLQLHRESLKPRGRVISRICNIGIPVALQDGFIQISFIVITIIANGRGLNDAAAVGIVEKFIGLLFIVPSSMLGAVSAITAQNVGAGQMWRAVKALKTAIVITLIFGLVSAITIQFCSDYPIRLFTANEEVVKHGGEYLQSYVWDCIPAGVHFCFSGFFTAIGFSGISFVHNVVSIVLARIPLAVLASNNYPETLYPMGFATPIGSLLSVMICLYAFNWLKRHKKNSFENCGHLPN